MCWRYVYQARCGNSNATAWSGRVQSVLHKSHSYRCNTKHVCVDHSSTSPVIDVWDKLEYSLRVSITDPNKIICKGVLPAIKIAIKSIVYRQRLMAEAAVWTATVDTVSVSDLQEGLLRQRTDAQELTFRHSMHNQPIFA